MKDDKLPPAWGRSWTKILFASLNPRERSSIWDVNLRLKHESPQVMSLLHFSKKSFLKNAISESEKDQRSNEC